MRFGLPYQGSKDILVERIMATLPHGRKYRLVDLFGGGGAVSDYASYSGRYGSVLYNELATDVYTLFRDAVTGKYRSFVPVWISKDDFKRLKETDPYIKFCWSFGYAGKNYLFGDTIAPWRKAQFQAVVYGDYSLFDEMGLDVPRFAHISDRKQRRLALRAWIGENYKLCKDRYVTSQARLLDGQSPQCRESLQCLQCLQNQERLESLERPERLERLEFSNKDYRAVELLHGDIIYCDPPYAGSEKYQNADFDHDAFWQWVRHCPYPVYVSEFSAPDDIQCVAEQEKRGMMAGASQKTHKTEKLYWNGRSYDAES